MDTPLFERPESSIEQVALADIQPWSARSATGKSITALGLRGVITLPGIFTEAQIAILGGAVLASVGSRWCRSKVSELVDDELERSLNKNVSET